MPHKDIPNMLGRVLSGTKYGVKQTRGAPLPPPPLLRAPSPASPALFTAGSVS